MEVTGNNYFRLIVQSISEPVPGFKLITFQPGHGIKQLPGQYLTFVFNKNNEELRRSYSICSFPGEDLSIGVKRKANGSISRFLTDELKIGDELITTGAGGFFLAPEKDQHFRAIYFFAAGSGITPVLPLVKTTLARGYTVVLVYSNSSMNNTIFYEELKELLQQYSSTLNIEFLFSDSKNILYSRLERDLLLQLLQRYGSRENLYYLCGPEIYMLKIQFILIEQGINKDDIRKENFVIHQNVNAILPPDTRTHSVHIFQDSVINSFEVHYPHTILQAAKKAGLFLPFSCEAGSCGNCAVKCLKGEVWHAANEVLMENDLKKGMILTCTGHPVNGDITISYRQ